MLEDPVADVLAYCKENNLLLTTAESCTASYVIFLLATGPIMSGVLRGLNRFWCAPLHQVCDWSSV